MKHTNNQIVKAGDIVFFAPTGAEFKIAKVTEKRVSWNVGFNYKGGTSKNILKMAWVSLKSFNKGIKDGIYIIRNY
jgi:hypothetical protein